jgi:hypothetical protein
MQHRVLCKKARHVIFVVIYLHVEDARRLEARVVEVLVAMVERGAMMWVHGAVDGLL